MTTTNGQNHPSISPAARPRPGSGGNGETQGNIGVCSGQSSPRWGKPSGGVYSLSILVELPDFRNGEDKHRPRNNLGDCPDFSAGKMELSPLAAGSYFSANPMVPLAAYSTRCQVQNSPVQECSRWRESKTKIGFQLHQASSQTGNHITKSSSR